MKNKLTKAEKLILENTPEEYRYIARDENGDLFIYVYEPRKIPAGSLLGGMWRNARQEPLTAFNHLFQNIKWKDEEPYKFR